MSFQITESSTSIWSCTLLKHLIRPPKTQIFIWVLLAPPHLLLVMSRPVLVVDRPCAAAFFRATGYGRRLIREADSAGYQWVAWGMPYSVWIKEVVLGFLLAPRWRSARCVSPSIWLDGRVPEGSTDEFQWWLMPGDCWIGWYSVVRTHTFIWSFGFRGSASKLCWLLISWSTFSFHDVGGKWHGSRDLWSNNGGSSLGGEEELAWCFMTWSSGMRVGAIAQEKFKALPFRGESPMSGLNWLCLAMSLLKALFWEWGFSSGWKLKIYDRATTALVHCYLFGGVAFGEVELLVLSWWY
jgi:hypothetical protein